MIEWNFKINKYLGTFYISSGNNVNALNYVLC